MPLNRTSPWTTCMLWLEMEAIQRRELSPNLGHLILPALPADGPGSSWGLPSCCALIYQFSLSPSPGEGEHWYTAPPPHYLLRLAVWSIWRSAVKGRPLHPNASQHHLGSLFQPCAVHILMTNMWLLMNHLPLCALGRSGEHHWIHADYISLATSRYFGILSLGTSCLELHGSVRWRSSAVVTFYSLAETLRVAWVKNAAALTTGDNYQLLDLLPYGIGGEKRDSVWIQPHALTGGTPGVMSSLSDVL